MMFPVVVREGQPFTKFDLIAHLEELNVETREMMPMLTQPCYAWMKLDPKQFPVADWVNRCGFYIGCHQGFGDAELAYIRDAFAHFFSANGLA